MFYFCEQLIPIPDAAELEQLKEVVKFRDELAKAGLSWPYPSHADFTLHVRGGLLRAIRDILHEESEGPPVQSPIESPAVVDSSARAEILSLVSEYEEIRRTLPSGAARTRRMTAVFSQMKAKAAGVRPLLDEFKQSGSPGTRLAALALLQMFPDARHLDWMAGRLDNPEIEKPFVGFQAAVALLEAVRTLPVSECPQLKAALATAKTLAEKLPTDSDRIQILRMAEQECSRKCAGKA